MEFESINILVDGNQLKRIESIIQTLARNKPQIILTPFKYGKIGDEILVSFKINQELYQFLIEKLTINGIHVVSQDERTQQYIDSAKAQIKASSSGGMMHWGEKRKPANETKKSIDELIQEGDYAEVIRIARDVSLPKEESDRAKANIDRAIHYAINNAYTEASAKKFEIHKNLNRLITIASDSNLQTLHKIDFMKEAGLLAVNICSQKSDYVPDLISICNNNKLHNLVCVKAAIAFYSVAFSNKEFYKEEIIIARKKLNTRWLLIAINSVEPDLTRIEKESFYALIDFINSSRR